GHGEGDRALAGAQADGDVTALGRVQVRIGEQVRQHLADPARVHESAGQGARQVELQALVLAVQARAQEQRDLADDVGEVGGAAVDLDAAGLNARHVEQVVDEVDEAIRAELDDLDELPLAVVELLAGGEQLDEALDRG